MKKQYIKPIVETLELEEQMVLLRGSENIIHTDNNLGVYFIGSRDDNTTFAEDEDISEDVY